MDSTAYILVAAAGAATALVMWRLIDPNQHRLKRVVIAVGAATRSRPVSQPPPFTRSYSYTNSFAANPTQTFRVARLMPS